MEVMLNFWEVGAALTTLPYMDWIIYNMSIWDYQNSWNLLQKKIEENCSKILNKEKSQTVLYLQEVHTWK